jgi:HEAT repeat protein
MIRLLSLLLCLASAAAGDELAELKVKLRDRQKWVRNGAVEKLADVGALEAWEEVIDALDDPAGEVCDTAQWELGRIADAEALELLLGKEALGAKDAWVRLRAAEALGRVVLPVDADELRKALGDKDERVRRALAATVARRGAEGVAGDERDRAKLAAELERQATKDRDPRAAGEAWMALAALAPERARAAWGRTDSGREPAAVRCAAARAADALELSNGALAALAHAEEHAVRLDAAEALARRGTVDAVRALVRVLEAEEEERLARRIAGLLRELSGLKHGRDPRPWRDWAAELPADWRPARSKEAWEEDGERTVALVGLPIRSGRIAILIDLSGSMWMDRADGKTRKEVVDEQLRICLESLPETTRFNLIPYTREPLPWKEGLVDATPRNTAAAAAWFEERDDQGTGNLWDAYLLALADPEVDTIVMLGDGEPTGGPRYKLELLPWVVAHENLGRAVTIDSILVDAKSRRTREAWQEIAAASGGTSITVDL